MKIIQTINQGAANERTYSFDISNSAVVAFVITDGSGNVIDASSYPRELFNGLIETLNTAIQQKQV